MAKPTANEQYMLELINRARLDPAGEAKRFGTKLNAGLPSGTIKATPKQPLAMNMDLLEAARDHSGWMLDKDKFSHTGAGGSDPGERMADAGYGFTGSWMWGENISFTGTTGTLDLTAAIKSQHKGLFKSSDHRENLLNGDFAEIGVAQVKGVFTDGADYNASMVTQDFAKSGSAVFVTGVMYDDKNGNDFYTPGEGNGGVSVNVGGKSSASLTAGGYQVATTKGFVAVTFDGDIAFKVDTRKGNAKVDLIDGEILDSSASLQLVSGVTHARLLGVGKANLTGSDADDRLEGNSGKNRLKGGDGDDSLIGGKGRDVLKGAVGDDILKGGAGKDKLAGGTGNDTLIGGKGKDVFVFNDGLDADVVRGFRPGQDRLDFDNLYASPKQALKAAESHAGDTVFDLGGGDQVTLKKVSVSDLSVEDFV